MNRRQIERFFSLLARELEEPSRVILTGAAAGTLWGGVRPSVDVDFAIELRRRDPALWAKVAIAIDRVTKLTGIQANFAENIDRWGLITLLDYRRHARAYRRFGKLRLTLLDPAYWSIGKMTRYLEPDVRDMAEVFRKQHIPVDRLVRLWGRALRQSPRSAALASFRRQVEDFLRHEGPRIWGKKFDLKESLRIFYQAAKIASIYLLLTFCP